MLLLFLFGFLLGFFLGCHKHLLLRFPAVGFIIERGSKQGTQARNFNLKTLPHFVGAAIIMAQQIVCQEKNIILEIFSEKVRQVVRWILSV